MKTRRNLYCLIAGLWLVVLVFVFWPGGSRSPVVPPPPVASTRSHQRTTLPAPAPPSKQVRTLAHLAQLAEKGELPKLTRGQIDAYLRAQNRSAGSLLAAHHLSRDQAFLVEAMEKFPNDPQVLLTSLLITSGLPEKQLETLAKLKLTDPGNGLGDCLAARALFELGKQEEAMAALSESMGKPFQDYMIPSCQNAEEAYLSAGFSPLEAKMAALNGASKFLTIQLRHVADALKKQRAAHVGNEEALQHFRSLQLGMADQIRSGGFPVDSLVAMSVEKGVLKEIDTPESQARLETIQQERDAMFADQKRITDLMASSSVPESDWLLYFDRVKLFGDKAASTWFLEKHPEP
ncbi:hypothetical protein JIN84_04090 [Luteolibacter yonseiensis]|uniref:Tetratricopeptide repeat protein n=1 Tax=Luteolibacter yonseiensis TaxID=1144680 RepID=A0A934R3U1_9BACT|nr:hypothetical protein [Luteolibacter yonseiensis]MBK1814780.1 hypothetical protein [Luteolibacter yonseiensis]